MPSTLGMSLPAEPQKLTSRIPSSAKPRSMSSSSMRSARATGRARDLVDMFGLRTGQRFTHQNRVEEADSQRHSLRCDDEGEQMAARATYLRLPAASAITGAQQCAVEAC